jgi:hypothetical protein
MENLKHETLIKIIDEMNNKIKFLEVELEDSMKMCRLGVEYAQEAAKICDKSIKNYNDLLNRIKIFNNQRSS